MTIVLATTRALVARSSSLAPCHCLFARWRRLLSFIACRRLMTIVRRQSDVVARHSSCPRRSFVVACALSLFVRSLAIIVILYCFSAPEDDRWSSLVVSRSSSPVRRRLCIVIIRSLVAKDRGPPLSLVAVRQLSVVAWAFSSSVRLLWTIAIVRRFSSPVGDRSSPLVGCSSLVRRRSRVVIVQSLVGKDCDPSLLAVAG